MYKGRELARAAERLRLGGARLPRVPVPVGGRRRGGRHPGARGDHHLRAGLRRRRRARAAGGLEPRPARRHPRPARAGRTPCGRAARAGRARRRRHRLPDLHLGHHRPAQGRDEHPRQRDLQRPGLPRLDRAGGGRRLPGRGPPVSHNRAGGPHRGLRPDAHAAGARVPVRARRHAGPDRAAPLHVHGGRDHRVHGADERRRRPRGATFRRSHGSTRAARRSRRRSWSGSRSSPAHTSTTSTG